MGGDYEVNFTLNVKMVGTTGRHFDFGTIENNPQGFNKRVRYYHLCMS